MNSDGTPAPCIGLPLLTSLCFVLLGCGSQPQSATGSEQVAKVDSATAMASPIISSHTARRPIPDGPSELVADSSLYVGEVNSFQETREYYTSVYYHKHLEVSELYELLRDQVDSLIAQNDEVRRSRLPLSVAKKYFNLAGLEDLSLYAGNKFVSKAKFVRVELVEGMIESQFVAVYKPNDGATFSEEVTYCVSEGQDHYKHANVTYEIFDDNNLTQRLLTIFAIDSLNVQEVLHTIIHPNNTIISAVTLRSGAFLFETTESGSQVLTEINEDYYLSAVTPVHVQINDKPLMLIRMGVNETDMVWTSLAVFNGREYVLCDDNRVRGGL